MVRIDCFNDAFSGVLNWKQAQSITVAKRYEKEKKERRKTRIKAEIPNDVT